MQIDRKDSLPGAPDLDRLIAETEHAIYNTRQFLDQLGEKDGPARDQIGSFVKDLEHRLENLKK